MSEELAKLLEQPPKTEDPELLKLVLLLANKALDKDLKKDENGALLVKTIDF